MIVCVGKYTKKIDTYQSQVKEYIATLQLGASTPSFDLETEIDQTYPTNHINRELIDQTLSTFIGSIEQRPPDYSAVKINGKRAYEYARKGQEVEIKKKTLVIDEIEVLELDQNTLKLRIVCSKGTYIRALARDIGLALKSGAHLTALQRTKIGDFRIDDAIEIEDFIKFLENL
jgi:tRNA pseudouridine55 synthase